MNAFVHCVPVYAFFDFVSIPPGRKKAAFFIFSNYHKKGGAAFGKMQLYFTNLAKWLKFFLTFPPGGHIIHS